MTSQRAAATSAMTKLRSLEAAIASVPAGATIALGGHGLMHRPMSALREITRQGLRGLRLVGSDGGIDADFLAGAGCLASLEGPLPDERTGLTANVRRAVSADAVHALELPSETAMARLRAAAMGLPFLPVRSAGAAQSAGRPTTDPFTGEAMVAVAAMAPDIAILHGRIADAEGNVRLHADDDHDASRELAIARAAGTVIVTVEQFASREAVGRGAGILLRAAEVAMVAEAPFGAHPCGFADRYAPDEEALDSYRAASATAEGFTAWLAALPDGESYLKRIGARRLMAISRSRLCID